MIERNIKLLKWDNFFCGLYALSMVLVIYFESITKSYAQAMLIYSISSIVKVAMEIPTGIFSDKIGRKKTIILSSSWLLAVIIMIGISLYLRIRSGAPSQAL